MRDLIFSMIDSHGCGAKDCGRRPKYLADSTSFLEGVNKDECQGGWLSGKFPEPHPPDLRESPLLKVDNDVCVRTFNIYSWLLLFVPLVNSKIFNTNPQGSSLKSLGMTSKSYLLCPFDKSRPLPFSRAGVPDPKGACTLGAKQRSEVNRYLRNNMFAPVRCCLDVRIQCEFTFRLERDCK